MLHSGTNQCPQESLCGEVSVVQLSAFVNSLFLFVCFLALSSFGSKMIFMMGKSVLKIFMNFVPSKEYYKTK